MMNFDQFFKELKKGALDIAKEQAAGFVKEATRDGNEFLDDVKADLRKWTKQLATGKMGKQDFAFLVKGKKDLAKMEALKQAGLAAIRVDQIRTAMIDLVITCAGKMV